MDFYFLLGFGSGPVSDTTSLGLSFLFRGILSTISCHFPVCRASLTPASSVHSDSGSGWREKTAIFFFYSVAGWVISATKKERIHLVVGRRTDKGKSYESGRY